MAVYDMLNEPRGEDRVADSEAMPDTINAEGPIHSPANGDSRERYGSGHNHPHNAVHAWRVIFVSTLVVLGAVLGILLGELIVHSVLASHSDIPFMFAYKQILETTAGFDANVIAYTAVVALFAALIAPAIFNKIVDIGETLKRTTITEKIAVFLGFFLGLIVTGIVGELLVPLGRTGVVLTIIIGIMLIILTTYLGIMMMQNVRLEEFIPSGGGRTLMGDEGVAVPVERIKLLDTNVIIDGRVADVCRTGFIEGPIYVPGFVLDELQHIADSADALKRARGRRGLDILNQMRSELQLSVRTLDSKAEYAHAEEVDARLVKLARKLEGAIVTNDFNLNKVAELQGVPVLNINELANALKPVVLPGEEMRTTVIKEGKEMNQGIAYLDDGTMIVIEGARRRIGETLDVIVSSVLQTVAGKMIFATIKQGDENSEEENGDRHDGDHGYQGPRGYSGGRPRRPLR